MRRASSESDIFESRNSTLGRGKIFGKSPRQRGREKEREGMRKGREGCRERGRGIICETSENGSCENRRNDLCFPPDMKRNARTS